MAWNGDTNASGGGYSSLFPRPAYQDRLPRAGATRGVPDVAANNDSTTAMALVFSDGSLGPASDANAATPLWAGVIALADSEAGQHLGLVNPAIYQIARGPAYHQAFHDVITGDNSVLWPTGVFVGYNAGPGWDPVTGWGSPDAQYLVPLLAHATRSGALHGRRRATSGLVLHQKGLLRQMSGVRLLGVSPIRGGAMPGTCGPAQPARQRLIVSPIGSANAFVKLASSCTILSPPRARFRDDPGTRRHRGAAAAGRAGGSAAVPRHRTAGNRGL
jgi:subtilase family serine protease